MPNILEIQQRAARSSIKPSGPPSRADLLRVLDELQGLLGQAVGPHSDDRDPNGYEETGVLLNAAFNLCIKAQGFDEPSNPHRKSRNGWNFPKASTPS